MNIVRFRFAWVVLLAGLWVSSSDASIVAVSGEVLEISAPPSVVLDALESDTYMHVFLERRTTVPVDVATDISLPGHYDSTADLTPGVIAAGSPVDSYCLHVDRMPGPGNMWYNGSITFDTPILGVIALEDGLNGSDEHLGSATTIYPSDWYRRFDFDPEPGDTVTLSADRTNITIQAIVDDKIDQLRIVTVVPEPATALLLLSVSPFLARRRRRA